MTLAVLLASSVLSAPATSAGELVELLLGMEAAYARITSYTARFTREETVHNKRRPPEDIFMKFRRPGSVYLRWLRGRGAGREILYVPGEHGNRALVHEPGILSRLVTVVLAPDSPLVLRESRHPIDRVGLGPLVELIAANVRRGWAEGDISATDLGMHAVGGRPTRRVEIVASADPRRDYYAPRVRVDVDRAWGLPLGVEVFDARDQIVERYAYRDIQLEPGLTDRDFSPDHPDYSFPALRISR